MAARKPFSRETQRRVGAACAIAPRTVADICRQLGRPDGSIRTTIEAMRTDGVLETTEVEHSDAVAYALNAEKRPQLEAALGGYAPTGLLQREQRLLLVEAASSAVLGSTLKAAAENPLVLWGARVDGAGYRFVLCVDDGPRAADRVEQVLARAGQSVAQLRVDEVLDGPSLVAYAKSLGLRRP
jgi:hypothetical protein